MLDPSTFQDEAQFDEYEKVVRGEGGPVILYADLRAENVQPANGRYFTYTEFTGIVGGYFEFASLADGRMLVCNEDGALKRLPYNPGATALFNQGGRPSFDPIAGDVLICALELLEVPEDEWE